MLLRYSQYQDALKDDAAFHRRYRVTPIEVKDSSGRKVMATVKDGECIFPTTREGLAKLKPVLDGGMVTYGGQTYPADGNAAMIVTTREKVKKLSRNAKIEVQLISVDSARENRFHGASRRPCCERRA